MAYAYTCIYVKNVDQKKFVKWIEAKAEDFASENKKDKWDFSVEFEGGYAGKFWESLAFEMVNTFEGIVFSGSNSLDFGDHCTHTSFDCDGSEISLERSIACPWAYDDEDEEYDDEEEDYQNEMRALWEYEEGIHDCVKFSVGEAKSCRKVYESLNKELSQPARVEAACEEHNVSYERFQEVCKYFI